MIKGNICLGPGHDMKTFFHELCHAWLIVKEKYLVIDLEKGWEERIPDERREAAKKFRSLNGILFEITKIEKQIEQKLWYY